MFGNIFGALLTLIGITTLLRKDDKPPMDAPLFKREPITELNPVEKRAIEVNNAIDRTVANTPKDAPRGIRNNNPGNLVKTSIPWQGKVAGTDKRFETFVSPEWGIRAMMKDIINDWKKGKKTIASLIDEYAPSHENDTQAYVNFIAKRTGFDPNSPLDLNDKDNLIDVADAIIRFENGNKKWYDITVFDKAVELI
jgi:HD-GYP domain-containing protein (c-di-GMP phosphodiesterase class II)